jgi:hypothetical protein
MLDRSLFPGYDEIYRRLGVDNERDRRHMDWCSIVEHYSDRRLSYNGDKLPAISAIAEYYAAMLSESYLAGSWDTYLVNGMMWLIQKHLKPNVWAQSPPKYRTPSWSWAAHNQRVRFRNSDGVEPDMVVVEIISYGTNLVREELPFGEVVSGQIILDGALEQLDIVMNVGKDNELRWYKLYYDCQVYERINSSEIWLLKIRDWSQFLVGKDWSCTGLILSQSADAQWKRVGFFELAPYDSELQMEKFLKRFFTKRRTISII